MTILMRPKTNPTFPATTALAIQQAMLHWKQNWKTRRQLASLSADELKDVGLTEAQRQEELNKFFWEQ